MNEPCRCPLYPFPHRHSKQRDKAEADDWQARRDEERDHYLDDPRHGQAAGINRDNVR